MSQISFTLNGKPFTTCANSTIQDILNQMNVDPSHVVVEVNQHILKPVETESTIVNQDDTVEVLRFVGGG